ncbi:hypothetical protein MIND_00283500 [Mycena indigotica]|uniref:Uncharacterized protein n=1 Tax=Mycena indigotica TaxID=2126181 RepID=A0A8H6T860_9AGAR|nr:uncharacterized protein MIND_00283500 [Mycena indigotica]KAF7312690.1 hypothetical protein MIND_00283500 [Mycena indigotica]
MNFLGLAIDYIVVQVGEFTNIEGETALVDDTSGEIQWSGGWAVKRDYQLRGNCSLPTFPYSPNNTRPDTPKFLTTFFPHGNSTHSSAKAGDSFQFLFSGTSVAVYGVSPGSTATDDWELNMTFDIDGNKANQSYTASLQNGVVAPHFEYFSATLSQGSHTLTATIVNAAGNVLPSAQIDYITYAPDFGTPHDRPMFPVPSSSFSASSTASNVPSSSSTMSGKKVAGGVIGGGVVAGIIGLVGLVAVAWLLRSRMNKKHAAQQEQIEREARLVAPEPFLAPSSPMSRREKTLSSNPPLSGAGGISVAGSSASQAPTMREGFGEASGSVDERVRQLQIEMEGLRHQVHSRGSFPSTAPPAYTDSGPVED